MFLCSLRYCLKCYFSKGVYSFTLSTVHLLPNNIIFILGCCTCSILLLPLVAQTEKEKWRSYAGSAAVQTNCKPFDHTNRPVPGSLLSFPVMWFIWLTHSVIARICSAVQPTPFPYYCLSQEDRHQHGCVPGKYILYIGIPSSIAFKIQLLTSHSDLLYIENILK